MCRAKAVSQTVSVSPQKTISVSGSANGSMPRGGRPTAPAPVASSTVPPAAYGIQVVREWWTTDIMANSTATSYEAGADASGSSGRSYRANWTAHSARTAAITVPGCRLRASMLRAIAAPTSVS